MTSPTRVDARGVLCPVPVIRLARAVAQAQPGTLVELLTDDPAAEFDVPAWCRLRGHELVATGPWQPGDEAAVDPGAVGAALVPPGAEPDAANLRPDQALRHLIRVGGPAASAG